MVKKTTAEEQAALAAKAEKAPRRNGNGGERKRACRDDPGARKLVREDSILASLAAETVSEDDDGIAGRGRKARC